MASEQGSPQRRTQKKRLARAKIKRPEAAVEDRRGAKRSSGDDKAPAKTTSFAGSGSRGSSAGKPTSFRDAARKEANKERAKRIGIGIFAVVIALSMMIPSVVTIMSNMNRDNAAQTEAAASADDTSAQDEATSSATDSDSAASDTSATDESSSATDSAADSSSATDEGASLTDDATSTTTASIDERYKTEVTALETRLKEDKDNLAALLNLGKEYMSWGYNVSYYASSDESAQSHATELFDKAIEYYDRYLALNDSNAVKVDRALCQFYAGDYEAAQSALEKLTKEAADYGPAWANLGMIYESTWKTDEAQEAYKKAAEADPNDEYGAKSFANQRLASLNQSELTESQDVVDTSASSSTTGLSQTLADASGTSF